MNAISGVICGVVVFGCLGMLSCELVVVLLMSRFVQFLLLLIE